MNWLSTHSWLATWLSLPLMVILGVVQMFTAKPGERKTDLFHMMLYLIILASVGVVFSPIFDQQARSFAQYLTTFLIFAALYTRQ